MYRDRLEEDVKNWFYKKPINEATTDGGSRGSYLAPLRPGKKIFDKNVLAPFTDPVSKYDSALLAVDSYDGSMDETKNQIKKIESLAVKSSEYAKKHPVANDDDGDNINPYPVNEWVEIRKSPKKSESLHSIIRRVIRESL